MTSDQLNLRLAGTSVAENALVACFDITAGPLEYLDPTATATTRPNRCSPRVPKEWRAGALVTQAPPARSCRQAPHRCPRVHANVALPTLDCWRRRRGGRAVSRHQGKPRSDHSAGTERLTTAPSKGSTHPNSRRKSDMRAVASSLIHAVTISATVVVEIRKARGNLPSIHLVLIAVDVRVRG